MTLPSTSMLIQVGVPINASGELWCSPCSGAKRVAPCNAIRCMTYSSRVHKSMPAASVQNHSATPTQLGPRKLAAAHPTHTMG